MASTHLKHIVFDCIATACSDLQPAFRSAGIAPVYPPSRKS